MRQIIVLIIALALAVVFVSCGDVSKQEHENLKAQLDQLEKENETLDKDVKAATQKAEALEKELDEIKYAPDRLLLQAKNLFDDKRCEEARVKLNSLMAKHPDAKEAEDGKKLLATIKPILERLAKEKEEALKRAKKQVIANATRKLRRTNFEGYAYYSVWNVDDISDSKIFLKFSISPDGKLDSNLYLDCLGYSQLGVTRYVIKVDGKDYALTPTGKVNVFEAYGGKFEESYWFELDAAMKSLVRGIISSNITRIQFWGVRGLRDHIVSDTEKDGLKKVLDAIETIENEIEKLN
jgi:uncharacterized protein YoxC